MKEKKEASSYLREALEQNFPQYQEDKNAFGIAADALEEYERKGILGYEDIVEHFLHDGRLQYEGFPVRDAHSLALLLQTFRNVQFETFRMVYTKGDTIAAITGVESRLPHLSFTMPEKSISKGFYNIQRRMERLGADGFYMVHNHPTGDVLPSADDTNETMRFAQNLPGFRGHIILDHTKYSVLDENGVIGIYDIPEDYQNPLYYETETFLIGTKVRNSDEVAAFFDHLNPAPERSLLVLTTAKGSIRTFEEVSNKVILHDKNFKNYIRNEMVRNGCTHAFLATQSEEIYDSCRPLVIDRYLMDAVFLDEIGMESVNRWMHEHNVERNKEIEWAGLHLEKMHRDKNNSGKMPTSLLREEISPYEFEQEVKSMNMTAEEFLMAEELSVEERDAYGYTYEEMMALSREGALQLFDNGAPVFLLYGDNTESQVNDRTEILEHDGIFGIEGSDWVAVKDKIFAAEGNKMQEDEELQEEMRQWFSNAYEEEDPAKEKPEEKEIRRQYLNILREEDKKENIAMQSLTYASDAFFDEVSMRLSAIKGCYWRSYTDGTGSLRRLHTDTVILEYVLTPADSKYDDEYEDATGWHSFDGSEDFRLALEKIVIEGIVSPMDHGANNFDLRSNEFEQEEVRSMNMTPGEFLEEMRVYFAGEKEAMSTDGLIFTDEVGADIELQVSNLKDCYWEIFESSQATLYRLSSGNEVARYDAVSYKYLDASGWHRSSEITDDIDAAIRMIEGLLYWGEGNPVDGNSVEYMEGKPIPNIFNIREDYMHTDEYPSEKEIAKKHLEMLREADERNDIKMPSLSYSNDVDNVEVSMRLAETLKGCYWKTYDDGSGSLRRLQTDTVILGYNLHPVDSGYDEYEDARGWHGFERSEDFRLALEKIVIEGIVSPMDHGAKDFALRSKEAKRLFIDMDGTLAEFHPVDTMETLYEQGYFAQLAPHENVVNGIKTFMRENPDAEVFILSSVLTDSPYAQAEKNAWLDRYLPEIGMDNRIFVPCGSAKNEFVPGGVRENDALLDDYSKNLHEWPGKALKLMNGINGTKGSFQGEKISAEMPVAEFAGRLASFCEGEEIDDMNMENKSIENAELLQGCYWKTTESGVYLYRESNNQTIAIYQPPQNLISESGEHSLSPENIHPKRSIEAAVASGYILPMDGGERPKIRINVGTKKLMENQYYPFNDDWFSFFVNAETGERKFKLETSDVELLDKESAIKAEELKDAEIAASKESAVTPKMQTVFQMMNGHLTSNPQAAVEKREYGMQDVCKAELLYPVSNTENKVIKLTATQDAAQALSKYNEGDIITFVGIPTNDGYKICRMDDGTVFAKQQKMLYDFTMRGEIPENDRKRELALSDIKEGFKNLSYEEKFKLVLEEEVDCHDNEDLKEELWESFRDNDSYLGFFGKDEVAELIKRRDRFLEIQADTEKDGGMEL